MKLLVLGPFINLKFDGYGYTVGTHLKNGFLLRYANSSPGVCVFGTLSRHKKICGTQCSISIFAYLPDIVFLVRMQDYVLMRIYLTD